MATKHHPKPNGAMVDFYLGANPQYQKGEKIPLSINGHTYVATVGQRNTLPRELVALLQDSKSRTAVVDRKQYDPAEGGRPRAQEAFFNPQTTDVYQSEFDVEVIKVHE